MAAASAAAAASNFSVSASKPAAVLPRRHFLLLPVPSVLLPCSAASADVPVAADITARVFMDFSICPSALRPDRPLAGPGSATELSSCSDAAPLGRVVFGLFGRRAPLTTANFSAACAGAVYRGVPVHRLLPGRFFAAGRQARRSSFRPPLGLDFQKNLDAVDPKAFELPHLRPGTLSLCLGENDDDDEVRLNPEYHNLEFLVTTGPGPCPELDGQNIVFGAVLEGMDVVTSIASIPTYKPSERIRQFNDFAEFIGDDRAQIARNTWNRPLKTVYISDCGEIEVAKPSLTPSLP